MTPPLFAFSKNLLISSFGQGRERNAPQGVYRSIGTYNLSQFLLVWISRKKVQSTETEMGYGVNQATDHLIFFIII